MLATGLHVDPVTAGEATQAPVSTATAVDVSGTGKRTTFRVDMSEGVTAEIFTLANPYRVIVDLPDVTFELPDGTGQKAVGLVKAFRYGLFAERKARMVVDTDGPVRVERAAMADNGKGGIVFSFDLVATAPESFGQGTGAKHSEKQQPKATPPAAPQPPATAKEKPVVIIDPGHGGIDGGATGVSNTLEKAVVLSVAKELERALLATGRYEVVLTRKSDVFISLDQRLALSEKVGADLFLSLHADSLADQTGVQRIRGATVYTLSERASDEQARRMAEKENSADLAAGLDTAKTETDGLVRNILFDLMKRETANFSADLSNTLVRQMKRKINLSRDPQRSAAFKVLKQTTCPSVLIELGYLSSAEDEQLLNSPAWQRDAATAIASAVNDFFAKRKTPAPKSP